MLQHLKDIEAKKIVSDEDVNSAFAGTNFGANPHYRKIIKFGLLKIVSGYANGKTVDLILKELKLTSLNKYHRPTLTKRGKEYLWLVFSHDYNNE